MERELVGTPHTLLDCIPTRVREFQKGISFDAYLNKCVSEDSFDTKARSTIKHKIKVAYNKYDNYVQDDLLNEINSKISIIKNLV